jgi:ketosteroid isomerase-like protein
MSVEDHRELASRFFARVSASDIAGALDLLSDDVTWWLAGKPALLPVAGVHDKAGTARILNSMVRQVTSGFHLRVKRAIAEGDDVVLEVESHGELRNGRTYSNEHCILMTIRDGKISAVREYYDTQHTFATWFQP